MRRETLLAVLAIISLILVVVLSCKKDESAKNNPPTCKIISPVDGQAITKGETIVISTDANDSDGNIYNVCYYIDGIEIDNSNIFPYYYNWTTSNESLGNHIISVECYDNDGESNADEITIEIVHDPVADFSANIISGLKPFTVNFIDQSSNNPISWQWDFGDGESSTLKNPTHVYNSTGAHAVSLIVTNVYGTDTVKKFNFISVGSVSCPLTFVDQRDNQEYSAIQIGSQCWMAENLNVGIMINNLDDQINNSTIEKYCYENDTNNCTGYGGLYQWDEMMQYVNTAGTQGICPLGWHIPDDEEWKILEGNVDSEYGIGAHVWNWEDWRGYDAGTNLKAATGWNLDGYGNNMYGFSALPGGYRSSYGGFNNLGDHNYLWTSTEFSSTEAWIRGFNFGYPEIHRDSDGYKGIGFSVRCVK